MVLQNLIVHRSPPDVLTRGDVPDDDAAIVGGREHDGGVRWVSQQGGAGESDCRDATAV